MIKINVVAVGKVKEKYYSEGIAEYAKRLSRYCEFKITEVAEENFAHVVDATKETILRREAERIRPHLAGKVFAMAIEGIKFTSETFARRIKECTDAGDGVITFVIGGSYGLSDEIKKAAAQLVSFSDMTFPHTLFRLMLTEQIYRAFSIIGGGAYHK